jgi:hypothetical protein
VAWSFRHGPRLPFRPLHSRLALACSGSAKMRCGSASCCQPLPLDVPSAENGVTMASSHTHRQSQNRRLDVQDGRIALPLSSRNRRGIRARDRSERSGPDENRGVFLNRVDSHHCVEAFDVGSQRRSERMQSE